MNCNSNTVPLINSSDTDSCNTGCANKNIFVICRNIIIPVGQDIIAVQNDLGSVTRTFVMPETTENGDTLEGKTFIITSINSKGQLYKNIIPGNNVEVKGNSILVKWELTKFETIVNGNLQVQIEAVADNFKWSTKIANFTVYKSISADESVSMPSYPTWADMNLNDLPDAQDLAANDLFLISQNGINRKGTLEEITKWITDSVDIEGIKSNIQDLQNNIATIDGKVNINSQNIKLINNSIDTIKQDVEDNKKSILNINNDILDINNNILDLNNDIKENTSSISEIKNNIVDLNSSIKENTDNISNINKNINEINNTVSTINTQVEENTKNITEIKSDVYELREDFNNFTPTVSGEGENLTLNGTANVTFKSFLINGNQYQATREGYNLFNYSLHFSTDWNGLKNVINTDGSITSTGKPTANYTTIAVENITDKLEDGKTYTLKAR